MMPLKVTFDTNVLDLACRPERFPKDPRQPDLLRVRDALEKGEIEGFYSVTMLTIEGVMKRDRAQVYGNTRIATVSETVSTIKSEDVPDYLLGQTGGQDVELITLEFRVEQPDRRPLHPEVAARARAAHALGLRVLKDPPRIGAFRVGDPDGRFYLSTGTGDCLNAWIARVHEVVRAIEERGVGMAQMKALGLGSANAETAWFKGLQNAKDIHQERAIERAFGEWADGDALASHIAYDLDIFCSADVGNSNAINSILAPLNRQWLTDTYGVRFMTFDDLLATLR